MHVSVSRPSSELDALRTPRDDIVHEVSDGVDRWVALEGPFRHYERTLTPDGDGTVVERTDFALDIPVWWVVFAVPYRAAIRRAPDRRHRRPWWAPPDPFDARASRVLALLCCLALIDGYVGTLLTQTITYAAREFGASRGDQGLVLAVVRAGALVSLVAGVVADRRGRRRPLLGCATLACVFAASGALVNGMPALALTQLAAAGCAGAVGVLIAIVSAEEVPAGSRAYAYSLIVMVGALGAGMCVWFLPLADLGTSSWRLVYAIPLLGVALVLRTGRALPESRRFERPHVQPPLEGHGRRLRLLAAVGFLGAIFVAPAFQFQNDFLRQERGFSAAHIALFTLITSTPGGIGIVVGGRLADVRGRRIVAAIGVVGGTIATVAMFLVAGWPMWAWSIVGSVVGAMTVPSLAVYRPELFPTGLRGKTAGIVEIIALSGSAVGLVVVGRLADHSGSFAGPMALAAIPTIAVVALIVFAFPETARRSLEDLNPEDAPATV